MLKDTLIHLRKKEGLSQEQLAEVIHVSRQTISKWENGVSEPDITSLVKIAQFFNISLDKLLAIDSTQESGNDKILINIVLLFVFGVGLGIITKNFIFGFLASIVLPVFYVIVYELYLKQRAKKNGDIVELVRLSEKNIPRNIYGKRLDIEAKDKRIKSYVVDATIFALLYFCFDLTSILFNSREVTIYVLSTIVKVDYILTFVINFGLIFIGSFLIDYYFGEYSIKKYKRLKLGK